MYPQLSAFHDIGKALIDQNIINKPGTLTESEYNVIKSHPNLGVEILEKVTGCDSELVDFAIKAAALAGRAIDVPVENNPIRRFCSGRLKR